jgi:hypothetical protein
MPYSKLPCSIYLIGVIQQQKEVCRNDDLRPVKVITADIHGKWSVKEGVPSGMVRSTSWCISLSFYVVLCGHLTSMPYLNYVVQYH